jgi:isopentenyl diphosphate isomerase/L-lactate dehydrogenase-like FMN-dependent dehydrogenase
MNMPQEREKVTFSSIEEIRETAYSLLTEQFGEDRANFFYGTSAGSLTGASYRRNRNALDELRLRTRLLHGINDVDTSTTILGKKISTPILVAPIAGASLDYNVAVKSCSDVDTLCLIGYAQPKKLIQSFSRATADRVCWIVKPLTNLDEIKSCYAVAEEVGCLGVGMDIDSGAGLQSGPALRPPPNWSLKSVEELSMIRDFTTLPFIVKGVMCVEDAEHCVTAGANAIIVSNHSGHALDSTQSPIDILADIVDAVGGKVDILMDGGIRHGTDVLKALASGAQAVCIGRPAIWGYTSGGESGLTRVFEILTRELERAMKLTGISAASAVSKTILV